MQVLLTLFSFFFNFIFSLAFIYLAELKMDVLRERECKDSMERQLSDERKLRGKFLHILVCIFSFHSTTTKKMSTRRLFRVELSRTIIQIEFRLN